MGNSAAEESRSSNLMDDVKGRILIVEDEADIARLLKQRLTARQYECFIAVNGEEALIQAQSAMPDLILLDLMLPLMDGFEVKRRLNEDERTAPIPVIFLTARDDVHDKVTGLSLDAADYVCKPFEFAELFARIESAVRRRRYYEQQASTDPLTGLNNLLFFKKQLHHHFETAARYNRPFSLAVIDIDNFKGINDAFGHTAGDAVMRSLAGIMKEVFRKADIPIRYGGDEFVVLFPETQLEEAISSLKRLEEAVEKDLVALRSGEQKRIRYSISAGAAGFDKRFHSPEDFFEAADKKMYEQKTAKVIKEKGGGKETWLPSAPA